MVMESPTPFWKKKKTLNLISSRKYSGNPHKGLYVQRCIPCMFLYKCCKVNSLTSCNSSQDCFKDFEPNLYIVLANFRSGRWQKKVLMNITNILILLSHYPEIYTNLQFCCTMPYSSFFFPKWLSSVKYSKWETQFIKQNDLKYRNLIFCSLHEFPSKFFHDSYKKNRFLNKAKWLGNDMLWLKEKKHLVLDTCRSRST